MTTLALPSVRPPVPALPRRAVVVAVTAAVVTFGTLSLVFSRPAAPPVERQHPATWATTATTISET